MKPGEHIDDSAVNLSPEADTLGAVLRRRHRSHVGRSRYHASSAPGHRMICPTDHYSFDAPAADA
jgi:hypothetical protein